ncbi:MAG: VOC family protein [Bacteroidota bacterium]
MLPDPTSFLDQIFKSCTSAGLPLADYPLDHICYRVATTDRYQQLKTQLLSSNELLAETLINGRPIATFRLKTPLRYQDRQIELLELPSPKPGSPYAEGYEHVEFVVGQHPKAWMKQYPSINWEVKDLRKSINPDVRLRIGEGVSVKFHEFPLDYVIEYLDE